METSLMVNDYPEPNEEKEKHVKARVTISFDVEYDVPDEWEELDIERDIKQIYNELNWCDEKIEDVEIK